MKNCSVFIVRDSSGLGSRLISRLVCRLWFECIVEVKLSRLSGM